VTKYSVDGKPDTVIDHRGMTTYHWGSCCGQLVRVDNPDGSFMEYEYDANKSITARITPWGRTEYSFDALNRNDSVYANDGTVTAYFYDAIGRRDSTSNSNGTSVGYEFDNLNRLTRVTNYNSSGVISDFTYTVNNAGIETSVTEADGSRVDYGYDGNYRLTSEIRTGANTYNLAFTYDNVGNRLTKDLDGQVTSYTYNNRDQLTNEGAITYSYDASGRQTTKDSSSVVSTFSWMDNDRLQSVTNQNGIVNSTYDLKGQKVRSDDGTNVTNFLIDHRLPYGQVVTEYQDGLTSDAIHTYGLEHISQNRGGSVNFYFSDGQQSTRNLTDASGNITDSYSYYGFGDALSSIGTTANIFRYVGEELNGFTNLYNLRARWYNQGNGRFVSSDPFAGWITKPVSLHKYQYANNSPATFIDPSGNFTLTSVMATVAISNILAAQPIVTFGQKTYCARLCVRPLWEFQGKHTFGILEHHNVKLAIVIGKDCKGKPFYTFQRGFFADNPGFAAQQALLAEAPFSGVDGWVPGHIRQDGNVGKCELKKVSRGRYQTIANRIVTANDNSYHLRYWNCQHWAADKLK